MLEIKTIDNENFYDSDLWITIDIYWYEITCENYWSIIIEKSWFSKIDDIKYIIVEKEEYINYTLNYYIKESDREWLDSSWFKRQKILLENVEDKYIIIDYTKNESNPNRLVLKSVDEKEFNEAINYFCDLWFITRSFTLYWLLENTKYKETISNFIKEEREKITKNYNKAKKILESKDYKFKKVVMFIVYDMMGDLFDKYASEYNTNAVNSDIASELSNCWFSVTHHSEYLIYPNEEREDINSTRYENLYNEFIDLVDYYTNRSFNINRMDIDSDINGIMSEYNEFIQEVEKQDNPINKYLEWFDSVVEDLKEEHCKE